jgi:tetrahydromethanopterin S-methyltransferase subunit G
MVFANIYTRLNELEQKVNFMTQGTTSPIVSVAEGSVDLSPINDKIGELHVKTDDLSQKVASMESKLGELPTEYVSPQDVSNLFEKSNQITAILAQMSMQLNGVMEKVASLEKKDEVTEE